MKTMKTLFDLNEHLAGHFTLGEMLRSGQAIRLGIDNIPGEVEVEALRALCQNVLEPLRLQFGRILISSGYRCERLNKAVGGVFVRVGAGVVLKGMLIGNALALLFCLIQGTTHLIPLDPANYFVSYVPVHVNLPWILAADVLAFLAILAMLWLPALYVSKIDPAVTVKAD